MIPDGMIYAQMRSRVLQAFPAGVKLSITAPITFVEWAKSGTYLVPVCDKKQVVLECNQLELPSVFLGEAELFADHAIEQLCEIEQLCIDGRVRSDAWGVVTIYYFGFFALQSVLRLLGTPVVYLDKDVLRDLQEMSGATERPGAGAFHIQQVPTTTVDRASFRLTPSGDRLHEAAWKSAFKQIEEHSKYAEARQGSAAEIALYADLRPKVLKRLYGEYSWPEIVRARANYRAGFAYQLVRGRTPAKARSVLANWDGMTASKLASMMSAAAQRCEAGDDDQFELHTQALFNTSAVLFLLGRKLYADLLDRRRLDRRWEQRRCRFWRQFAGTFQAKAPVFTIL